MGGPGDHLVAESMKEGVRVVGAQEVAGVEPGGAGPGQRVGTGDGPSHLTHPVDAVGVAGDGSIIDVFAQGKYEGKQELRVGTSGPGTPQGHRGLPSAQDDARGDCRLVVVSDLAGDGGMDESNVSGLPFDRIAEDDWTHPLRGEERGCGLKQSAEHAIRFGAEVFLRLERSSLHLVPANSQYQTNVAYGQTNLPLLKGTHISFVFTLDKVH